jgi:toxin ParE1/3/4
MGAKPVVPRARAHLDVEEAIVWYMQEVGADSALGFVAALEKTYTVIADRPGIGSPRYAHELDLPHLRHRKLARFPYLVFYIERDDHVDVWRVLDVRRDIPEWLTQAEYRAVR